MACTRSPGLLGGRPPSEAAGAGPSTGRGEDSKSLPWSTAWRHSLSSRTTASSGVYEAHSNVGHTHVSPRTHPLGARGH